VRDNFLKTKQKQKQKKQKKKNFFEIFEISGVACAGPKIWIRFVAKTAPTTYFLCLISFFEKKIIYMFTK
jgi:hypothetical protein